jgi:hypothetical protein
VHGHRLLDATCPAPPGGGRFVPHSALRGREAEQSGAGAHVVRFRGRLGGEKVRRGFGTPRNEASAFSYEEQGHGVYRGSRVPRVPRVGVFEPVSGRPTPDPLAK